MGSKIQKSNVTQLKSLQDQIDALNNAPAPSSVPVGAVLPFSGRNTAVPSGFLLCNGALLTRADFIELFNVIGSDWGTTSSTNFRIPTTNGLLLRGVAYGSGNDPDRNSRNTIQTGGANGDQVGTLQTDRYASHRHSSLIRNYQLSRANGLVAGAFGNATPRTVNRIGTNSPGGNSVNSAQGTDGAFAGHNGNVNSNDSSPNSAYENSFQSYYLNTNASGSNQTVGQNVGMNFIIKFE